MLAHDVGVFEFLKGQRFAQGETGDPAPAGGSSFAFRGNVLASEDGIVVSASLKKPSGTTDAWSLNFTDFTVSVDKSFPSESAINAAYPAGPYTLSIEGLDGTSVASFALGADPIPAAPKISNLAALASSNPANAVTVSWTPLIGGGASDAAQLKVFGTGGNLVFATPAVTDAGALSGTSTSASIPGGTLSGNASYTATLTFVKVMTRDTTSIAEAVGIVGLFAETSFGWKFGGGSTGTGGGGTGGGTGPCTASQARDDAGSIFVFKTSNWSQSNGGQPAPALETPASFFATVTPPVNATVSAASIESSSGATKTLTNLFGRTYIFFQNFANEAALDAAYPSGNSKLNVAGSSSSSVTVSLPANGFPPVPHVTNYDPGQAIDPGADFTLRWDPIPGATANEAIHLSITGTGTEGSVFEAPDLCVPRELPSTASSIVIPKGTFAPGKVYEARLTFSRFVFRAGSVFPGGDGGGGLSRVTILTLKTTGTAAPTGPRFSSVIRRDNGTVELKLEGTSGSIFNIERSADLVSWTLVQPVFVLPSGVATATDAQSTASPRMFYRARGL